jgi:hypothetical protein
MAKLIASYKSDGPEPKTIYEKYLDHTTNYKQQYGKKNHCSNDGRFFLRSLWTQICVW